MKISKYCKALVGSKNFHHAENTDGIAESSHKNGIYSITYNVMEFVKVCMNLSKVGYRSLHLN